MISKYKMAIKILSDLYADETDLFLEVYDVDLEAVVFLAKFDYFNELAHKMTDTFIKKDLDGVLSIRILTPKNKDLKCIVDDNDIEFLKDCYSKNDSTNLSFVLNELPKLLNRFISKVESFTDEIVEEKRRLNKEKN